MDLLLFAMGVVFTGLGCLNIYGTLKIISTKAKKISELSSSASGNSIISGTVLPDKTMPSPITQTPCVYCMFQTFQQGMKKKIGHGTAHTAQNMLGSGSIGTNFLLKDETGMIELDAKNAFCFNIAHKQGYYDNDKEFKDKITQFKVKYGIGSDPGREYFEHLILPNDKIWVLCKTVPGQKTKAMEIYSKAPKQTIKSPLRIIATIALLAIGIYLIQSAL
jgi:hypothetical protein